MLNNRRSGSTGDMQQVVVQKLEHRTMGDSRPKRLVDHSLVAGLSVGPTLWTTGDTPHLFRD